MLSYEQIKELVELVSRHRLGVFELERSGFRLRIDGQVLGGAVTREAPSGDDGGSSRTGAPSAGQPAAGGAPSSEADAAALREAAGSGRSPGGAESRPAGAAHVLTSPIVGTYYGAPAPDAEPFTRVGERVRKGQVLCIVEAMKLMNEIESDVDGVVTEIFPRNAQPVEFGEPLFAIRTD